MRQRRGPGPPFELSSFRSPVVAIGGAVRTAALMPARLLT